MENNQFESSSFLDVLLTLKTNIFKTLKVATLALVQSQDKDTQTIVVKPFPLVADETEKNITCYYLKSDSEFEVNQIIVILFVDRNFIYNLTQLQQTSQRKVLTTNDINLHSEKYGIVLNTY